jgi:L-fuconolactonase
VFASRHRTVRPGTSPATNDATRKLPAAVALTAARPYCRIVVNDDGPSSLSITDAHQHFWNLSVRAQPFLYSDEALAPLRRDFTVADLAPLAAAAGVTRTVVVQTVTEPGETPELLALAEATELVAAVVGWADLTATDVADTLAALRELPGASYLAGIRHPVMLEPDADWLIRPDVQRGLAAVAASGLTFDVLVRPQQLPAAVRAAAALPQLTFVLNHLGNVDVQPDVDQEWAGSFTALAALPNTFCKLSGILGQPNLAHIQPYYRLAIDSFGPDRLMFGSDWPVSTLGAPYGRVVDTAIALTRDLTQAEQGVILSGTARRVYRIGGA